jgi:outer membrane protein assembly factor BamE
MISTRAVNRAVNPVVSRGCRRPATLGMGVVLVASWLASGCATRQQASDSFLGLVTPYRIDIVQGNVVTREQVAAVRPGMTRQQVRDILGSPMLTDPFHGNRWDYVFFIRRPGADPTRRSVVAHFEGDELKKLEVPEQLPTENEFVAAIAPLQRKPEARTLELTEAQRAALPRPPRAQPPAETPTGPVRTYPPLEPR